MLRRFDEKATSVPTLLVMVNFLINLRKQDYFPLLIAFLLCGFVSIGALRHNNTEMIKLRSAVYTADKNGGDVNGALNKLRAYVYGHMNTDLSTATGINPPIQLAYTYDRLVTQAQQAANKSTLYTEAENYCQAAIPASVSISGRGRISCVQDYILNHGGKQAADVPASLYKFDFASPAWSPDLAGWALVATAISFLGLVVKIIQVKFYRH